MNWTTGKWDAERPHRLKAWANLTIETDPISSQSIGTGVRQALKVKYFLDNQAFEEDRFGRNVLHTINTMRIPGRSRDIKFEIVHNRANTGLNVVSFHVEGQEAGRVRARRN